jgi:hypothetical protein
MRLLAAILLVLGSAPAHSGDAATEPVKRELQLIHLFEGDKPEFVFVIGQAGFESVRALKEHLKTWPRGSELRWAPSCVRFGDEPLLSSEKDMKAFRAFLEQRGVTFVLVPSG